MAEMRQFLLSSVFLITFVYVLLLHCCKGTSITLSPLGMVSVCPGGQVLLTCERISGSFLYWTVSVPHLTILRKSTVGNQGHILSPEHKIGYTEFNITRISQSPALISQMLISNVTTWMNGSTIYCSEDRNGENNAPMVVINIDDALRSTDSLKVSLANHFFTNDVTVTLQWPQEDGAVYDIDILPQISHTDLTKTISHNTDTINLTISYNIQYNVSIVSSLCGVTTTKVLNYVTCAYPLILLLNGRINVAAVSDSPLVEGQLITYTCPLGFVLTGPNASVCMGNREWEPDPGQVECIADCGVPVTNRNVKLSYNSTLDGSVLILSCENEMLNINTTDEQLLNVTCHTNGNWIPDPAEFICSSFTTALPGLNNQSSVNSLLTVLIPSIIAATTLIIFVLTLCTIKRLCVTKKTSEDYQQPTYEEVTQCHKEILMEENAAYGHITYTTKNRQPIYN